jgi:hypothetical protein
MGGGLYYYKSDTKILNCTFNGNFAGLGGGLYESYTPHPTTITNCVISGNTTNYDGGGLYNCRGTIRNCTIIGNSAAGAGGGLARGDAMIINCTITGNTAGIEGGGISCPYDDPRIKNCIVWGNQPDELYTSTATVTYCDIEGGWEGVGNTDVDPEFVDEANGDYHLMWDSACVDAGDPEFVPEEGEVDIDGEPRVMGVRVDMGADEVGEKKADFTRNGIINLDDFGVLGNSWGTGLGDDKWYVLCDLWEDEVIDITDLAVFVEDWMWEAEWFE